MKTVVLFAVVASVMAYSVYSEEPSLETIIRGEYSPVVLEPVLFPESGLWKVEYDNTLDGEIKSTNTDLLVVEAANNRLTGHYQNKRAGNKKNDSLFTGEFVPGTPSIVTLRQDDLPRYTAVYNGRMVSESRFVGTYLDNHGFTGDWSMTLVSEKILEPLSTELPNDELLESVLGVYGKAIRGNRHPFVNLRPPQRNLWTEEIKEHIQPTISYGDVDYIGTAKLFIPETGTYTIDLPGAGVQFRINDELLEKGDIELKRGLYKVEIYTNHWGQPYLTYAEVNVFKKSTKNAIPFFNTAADIEEFLSQNIEGERVGDVCKYDLKKLDLKTE